MIELLAFTLIGIALGIAAGLIPGLHSNTVSILLLGLAAFMDPMLLAVAIVAMSITQSFFDFIPSIFLGAPDPETSLSIMPGHRLLLAGRGYEAVYLTAVGGLAAIFASILLSPLFLFSIPLLYSVVQPHIGLLLLAIALFMASTEKRWAKITALLVFLVSGILGLLTFNSALISEDSVLFVMFTGLFGISTLLISLRSQSKMPKQSAPRPMIGKRFVLSGIAKGLISGSIMGTLPGMGAATATVMAEQLSRKRSDKGFLFTIGSVNAAVSLFSILSLFTIQRARSGAAVAIQSLLQEFTMPSLMLFIGVAAVAAGISSILVLATAKAFIRGLGGIDYRRLTIATIIFLVAMVAVFTGPFGLLLLFASTSIGLLAPLFGVKRSNSMGVLMLPLILFYLGM